LQIKEPTTVVVAVPKGTLGGADEELQRKDKFIAVDRLQNGIISSITILFKFLLHSKNKYAILILPT